MFFQICFTVFFTALGVVQSTSETTPPSPSVPLVLDTEPTDKNTSSYEGASVMTQEDKTFQNTSYSDGNVTEIEPGSQVSGQPKDVSTPGGVVDHKLVVAPCSDMELSFNSSLVLWEESLRKCSKSGVFFDGLKALLHQLGNEPVCRDTEASSLFFYCDTKKRHSECLENSEDAIESEEALRLTRVMVERLCFFKESFRGQCLLERLDIVQSCIWTEVRTLMDMREENWTYGGVDYCRMSMLTKLCLWEELEPCGSDLRGKLAYSLFHTLTPPACDHSTSEAHAPYSISISILVLSSFALALLTSVIGF